MQQQSGNPAVRQGLIYGGFIILVSIIQNAIQFAVGGADAFTGQSSNRGVPGLGFIVFVVNLALLFLAGMFTARQNGKVGSATIAGLIAGVIGGIVSAIVVVIVLSLIKIPTTTTSSGVQITRGALIVGGVIAAVFLLLLYAGLGAGVGAIGGLIGRGAYQSRNPTPSYQESMYQGYQQPGAYPPPGQPQPGAYPQQFPQQYPPQQQPQYPPQYPPQQQPQQPPQYPPQQPPQYPQQ